VKAHLEECPSCRCSFSELGAIHSACFTQAPGFEVERAQNAEDRLRNSILRAASREGAQFSCHVRPQDMRQHPIGTGPFKFVSYKPGESIRLTRNPDYWKPDRPYLDGIEWTIIPNRLCVDRDAYRDQLCGVLPHQYRPPVPRSPA